MMVFSMAEQRAALSVSYSVAPMADEKADERVYYWVVSKAAQMAHD